MKARDCEVGMHVRDTRTGRAYRVVEKRVLASDAGAYCSPLETGPDTVVGGGLIYWEHLEPLGCADSSLLAFGAEITGRDGGESHG